MPASTYSWRTGVAVAEHFGAVLVLEDLRHVVHRRIQHCHILAVAVEEVEYGRHHIATVAHEGRARLDDDRRAVPVSNETCGFLKRCDVRPFVEEVASSEVDPFDLRENRPDARVEDLHSFEQLSEIGRVAV